MRTCYLKIGMWINQPKEVKMATFWGRGNGEEGHEWEICRFTKVCLYITFTKIKKFQK